MRRLRKFTKLPVAVGFGISTAEQFDAVGEFADAAVVGSAIVETIERNPGKEAEAVAQFIRQLWSSVAQSSVPIVVSRLRFYRSTEQSVADAESDDRSQRRAEQRLLMDISDWRKKIDELDRKLVDLLSQRAQAAHEIGKLKRAAGMPIYEPDRERNVFDNVRKASIAGPLPDRDLLRIYERIMDVMRQIQTGRNCADSSSARRQRYRIG